MVNADYYVPDERPWFKHYPEGVPHHLDYPEVPLYQFLDDSAEKYPNKTALVFYGKEITYKNLKELSDRFANALQNLGIQKGDRVAFLLPNCPQFVIGLYGAWKTGATAVCLNPGYLRVKEELKELLEDSKPSFVITLTQMLAALLDLKDEIEIPKIISCEIFDYFPQPLKLFASLKLLKNRLKKLPKKIIKFEKLVKDYSSITRIPSINSKENSAVLIYTSGSTGRPKGVMLTHCNIISNTIQFATFYKNEIDKGKESLPLITPIFHTHGLTACLSFGILTQTKLFVLPKFDPEELLKIIDKNKITLFWGVPTIYAILREIIKKNPHKYNLSSIKVAGCGAAPVYSEILKDFEKRFQTKIPSGLGLTETSALVIMCPQKNLECKEKGCIGLPLPDTDCKLIDPESKQEVGVGEAGELLIKGPQVTFSYWRKEELTKRRINDGWLYTGDILKMDEDGCFYFLSRIDDMFKVKGFRVYPRQIENVLEEHPIVKEAVVLGIKDVILGRKIKAYLILEKGKKSSREEIQKFCRDKLLDHQIPEIIEFVKDFPRSPMGKIQKFNIKDNIK